MAKQRRLRRQPISPPPGSFKVIVGATVGFLVLIALFCSSKFMYSTSRKDTQPSWQSNHSDQYPRLFSDPSEIPPSLLTSLDAVIILGGGVPESISHPPKYVERRCDDAIQVSQRFHHVVTAMSQQQQEWQQEQQTTSKRTKRRLESGLSSLSLSTSPPPSSLPLLCLSAGTAHLPQLLAPDGLPIWESTACAAYLIEHDMDPRNIYVETTSYDTIGNAFYARTTHTELNGWLRLLVITNEFHMDRTRAIFDWIFSLPSTSSSLTRTANKKRSNLDTDGAPYDLFYLQSPNLGLMEQAVAARKEREASSARTVRESLVPKYATSLQDVYQFLTQDHSLYTAQKLVDRGRGGVDDTKASAMVRQSYGATST